MNLDENIYRLPPLPPTSLTRQTADGARRSIFDDFVNSGFCQKFGFLAILEVTGASGMLKILFLFLVDFKIFGNFDFFGFWGVVWKFSREAAGLSWQCSVGCKDSSGLVGFDYDELHLFTPPAPPGMSW